MKKLILVAALIILTAAACNQKTPVPSSQNQPFFSNNETDISTWKTYTNSNLGFEFKYPGAWQINDLSSEPKSDPFFIGDISFVVSNPNHSDSFILSFFVESKTQSIELYPGDKPTEVLVSGIKWQGQQVYGSPYKGYSYFLATNYSGKYYRIILTNFHNKEIKAMLDQILTTYRFIK